MITNIAKAAVGEKHPVRRPIVGILGAGAVAAGLFHGVHLDSTVETHVKSRTLKSVSIDTPTFTMASFRTGSCVGATEHLKNPVPLVNRLPGFSDVQNHSLDKCADVVSTINIRAKKLVDVKPDKNGYINISLHGSHNAKKSDISLTEAIDPGTEKVNQHGDFTDSTFGGTISMVKAWAQAFGKNFTSPTDSIETILTKTDDQLLYDSVSSGPKNCANKAIAVLNDESTPKNYNYAGTDRPKTLDAAIGRFVYDIYSSKSGHKPTGVNVHWQLDPAGLPNEFSSEIAEARESGNKGFKAAHGLVHMTMSMTDPSKYPACGNSIPNSTVQEIY